jgi:hexosaminidase
MKKMDDSLAKSYFEKGEFSQLIEQDVPKDIVVQSWRGMEALLSSAKNGYKSILSKGYYIDLMQPTSYHYLNDPIPYLNSEIIPDSEADLNRFESEIIKKIEKGEKIITAEEEKLIIGGEATMWTEHTSSETIDSRIWPRTAAIAERLWSPSKIRDVDDMYRRMDNISIQLEWVGSTHLKNREMMLRRIAGTEHIEALKNIVDYIEPVKGYKRNEADNFTKYSPYTLMVDVAIADSRALREFNKLIDTLIKYPSSRLNNQLSEQLKSWQSSCQTIRQLAKSNTLLTPILVHAESLASISTEALKLLDMKKKKITPNKAWRDNYHNKINMASKASGYCELMIVDAFKKFVNLK